MSDNIYSGFGYVTRAAEMRYTPNGKALVEFKARLGGRYHTVTRWVDSEQEGSDLVTGLLVGSLVLVEGVASERTYTGADGNEKTVAELKAYWVGPLGGYAYGAKL